MIIENRISNHNGRTSAEQKIEGLAEIHAAQNLWAAWRAQKDAADAREDVAPAKPAISANALCRSFPRAAAYCWVEENFLTAAHDVKVCIGEKAAAAILAGTDFNAACKAAQDEWSKFCLDHID